MLYTVVEIKEDVDYGCEEREAPVMTIVTLRDDDENTYVKKTEDPHLIQRKIDIGNRVYLDENGDLQKAIISRDWTKDLSGGSVDVSGFVSDMEKLISGRKQGWKCPFCGEDIRLIHGGEGHYVINCSGCDMSIELEQK